MSYIKTNWKKGDKISSTGLNNLENGIYNAHTNIANIQTDVTDIQNTITNVIQSDINDILTDLNSLGYDLIIQSSVNVDLEEPSVSDFTIIEGNILDLEEKIDNGETINGLCILRNKVSSLQTKNKTIELLPLTYMYVPYQKIVFGACHRDINDSANASILLSSILFDYSEHTGSLTRVYYSIKSIQ